MNKITPILKVLMLIAICILAIGLSMTAIGRRVAIAAFSPFVSWCNAFINTSSDINTENMSDRQKIKHLENQIVVLQAELAAVDQLRQENNQLRHLAGLDIFPGWIAITAEIIARNPTFWNEKFIIGRGERDGIRIGSVVLSEQKVIGRVISCTAHTSEIHTILSPECRMSARIEGTQAIGICSAETGNEYFTIDFLPKSLQVSQGQKLLTSGLGGWMPDGLPIGEIVPDATGNLCSIIDDSRVKLQGRPYGILDYANFVVILVPGEKL